MSTETVDLPVIDAPIDPVEVSGVNDIAIAHDIESTIAEIVTSSTENFDPQIHAIDKSTGQPKRRGDGSFALKRGRKAGQSNSAPLGAGPIETPPQHQQQNPAQPQSQASPVIQAAQTISNKEAARQLCNLGIGIAVATLGDEWAPTSKEEAETLVLGFKNYFDAKGQIQLSPEWGIAIAVLAYSAPRLRHENTRTKLTRAALWVRTKVMGIRSLFKS